NFKIILTKEIYAKIPNAFWERKKYIVNLPYDPEFDEKNIPTRSRAIQMNKELTNHYFCINKNAEIERGVPRLVINNYNPLNIALRWIRYLILNKKDLLSRLCNAIIFSNFDMKS
ncbi:hypothetical protein CFOL_v3_25615, partial [Cephalotus follicularis]